MSQEYRIETDAIGEVKVPLDAAWMAQTQRSLQNFPTGARMPLAIIRALLNIKRAAALANQANGSLDSERANAIVTTIDSLLTLGDVDLRKDFPLSVYQTGSGTQTNMNTNEVVAHLASQQGVAVLPNDHVNMGQSSNDIFPTAMHIVAVAAVNQVEIAITHLIDELRVKQVAFWDVIKVGRTHLQDATPLTFGQELSGYIAALKHNLDNIAAIRPQLYELAMGGTAVGTGLNANTALGAKIAEIISDVYGFPFTGDSNKFYGLANHTALNTMHGALKSLAADLMKIGNDIRFLASGPRGGYGELKIPANEPGSSIMPGKVNPTQVEALTMAAVRVFGNDTTITMASSQGNFELNVFKPVMIDAFLESTDLLAGTMTGFADRLVRGLEVNPDRMRELLDNSLMTVTALSPHIGYHAAAEIAQSADKNGTTLKVAALASGEITEAQYDEWMDFMAMTNLERSHKE
ncbi:MULTISPECIES: class II fumarate hydratase [Leuconostoc]|jgi:fumarate hydratase class II|uniref:class II fumarate hydratase n=1 Tax=Leuconostoc TaxID=1243 RepID=UPI0002465A9A|nr:MULTISPECIES: class II fumarate hydratase [Leuconostoc]KAF0260145.1 class II fumarate hydratase [Leuconostoc citreum]MBA5938814.1 class II fumarate hydratase [Leuconostoc citreum]MBE4725566.1 class II fumarate hydratase [Leuconostoc citreum]MBU7451477.1 class II fumarate hydratase [Leuconostoc citreum]MCT3069277.1 class II fumarate hydratase [Leuconostoc citreum]